MQIESEVFLNCETNLHPKNMFIQDGDSGVIASTQKFVAQQQPARKPTRQWAAWTRQEEESFFTALRQVGKNFEKITCRVQSKNKDQVRHYYYRLVRRMNKLLGPGLCLDAKNSKDTNAAMLRWWSLLEKYSCKASKLHLKPRRFKIFIEALENQLLKDRKKNVKRRDSPGDNYSPTAPITISSQNRPAGHDTRAVKFVLVESPNIQKLGPAKLSFKRNVSIGADRIGSRKDSILKLARQRHRPVSSAAYKKWEKAAIAGVSLVADAAEHLERKDSDKEADNEQGESGHDPVWKATPNFSRSLFVESNIQSSSKLKLQLFPIDDNTRTALETDKNNPYLELTLSARKKISSVLEHLNRKWGNSSVASGELMLFPYAVRRENLVGFQRWSQDSTASASDVYAIIGSPPFFRLRYGWLSNTELRSVTSRSVVASSCILGEHNTMENRENQIVDSIPLTLPPANQQSREFVDSCKNDIAESSDLAANTSKRGREKDEKKLDNCNVLSAVEWADSLTNVSMGDLLSEGPDGEANDIETLVVGNSHCLQQILFSCDSFDAAIAAHISKHQGNAGIQSTLAPHESSILDAEETCDAFAFQKKRARAQSQAPSFLGMFSSGSRQKIAGTNSKPPDEMGPSDDHAGVDPTDDYISDTPPQDSSAKDFNGLTDMYWTDSLGPLDLSIPSSKYHNEDMILSDSLSGLNRLIASSLDAFQNCSFFGLDRKEHRLASPIVEVQDSAMT